jgi:indolepyruvate ferredoxin oxidoreductase alpha subunit
VLKISQYPIPKKLIRRMTDDCEYVLIAEEGQPFIEDQVRGVMPGNAVIKGRLTGELPRTGELNPDCLKKALGLENGENYAPCEDVTPRPPALCQGCGHRDVYTALNEVLRDYPNARVFGDIGCYTLGFNMGAINTTVCMGASITMAKGASEVGIFPSVAVIGDGTFGHSGLTGLMDCVNEKANVVVMILDNDITAMTGGQPSSAHNKIRRICEGLGVEPEHIRDIIPLPKNHEENVKIIEEEVNYNGVSVIIPHRTCIVELKKHMKK